MKRIPPTFRPAGIVDGSSERVGFRSGHPLGVDRQGTFLNERAAESDRCSTAAGKSGNRSDLGCGGAAGCGHVSGDVDSIVGVRATIPHRHPVAADDSRRSRDVRPRSEHDTLSVDQSTDALNLDSHRSLAAGLDFRHIARRRRCAGLRFTTPLAPSWGWSPTLRSPQYLCDMRCLQEALRRSSRGRRNSD